MQNKPAKFLDRWGRGLVLSVALHLIVLAVFLTKLPALPELPQEEESVAVELVPPPEEKPKPEEPKKEEEKKAEPPPPPPPLPVEEKKAEEPPPPVPVLKPATLFGEKDSGTHGDLRGDAEGKEADKSVETPPIEEKQEPEAAKAGELPAEAEPENTTESVDQPVDGAAVEEGETEFPTDQALALAAPPPPKPAKPAETRDANESDAPLVPKPVKQLYTASSADDAISMSSMTGESRGERISRLCGTELQAQLFRSSPPYVPYALPVFTLRSGNVVDAPRAAFGDVKGVWYDLALRCTVDEDATRVVDFSFTVGAPVPRSEWKKRRFPAY
ncbi:DUF930 domain-containing protein [Rhizobium cremeum]|uniref:DUF930 domain-containing protein n=1 Tax=Rhizobium cremeum TaxID=2813827 RepID=UPI001FD566F6|nr:DUF930 domain-containing protein [Rhizobium cremeum]MCJ7993454.1 DUF930 domain-containing protein [Rhizobium cremeum]MCJ7998511.1 DUF930 domain-containing protein [Rhizobium cremeum]